MSSDDPAAAASPLFPAALIASIRDAGAPDRCSLLALARRFRRDLAPAYPAGLSARTAVRLGYLTLKGQHR
ncbi:hypothetical protein OKW76_02260 [Sphingomonas sp. S1-29]|uniref:hypothetical protein n=1 Tax=Sphingomonas sp. S1-29 TaxID=2991074 RepID=UPI002240D599|nr:hypothetical protein [Sphingomonas sp. S1-29]UZK69902.1 hypothetical protein OKW76_02260 [Sphingomonas sp. S1-29]